MAHQPKTGGTPRETLPGLVRADELPVGVSLAWRLQVLIQSGRLASRDQLPGVREFAAGAGVNVNTARSVYRRLEDDGLTVSRQGLGTFVAPYVSVSPTLEELAAQVASDALSQGIDPRELARALYSGSSPDEPFAEPLEGGEPGQPAPRDLRMARASLRGQIARLEASLAPYPEGHPSERAASPLGPQPRVAELGELEAIRDDLVARLDEARAEAERSGEQERVERRRFEQAVADPAAHRWEAGQLDELGEPGCGRWQVRPAWGPVGALMNWWRVKISSGCP
jgi:DNA-binding transcriptional regulator YhcF (GntR family)